MHLEDASASDARVIVRAALLLREDFGDGGDFGYYGGAGGGWGGYYDPWPGSLYKAFIKPFVDVAKVAGYAVADVGSKAMRVAETVYQGLPSIIIPGIEASYAKIRAAEVNRTRKIAQKYAAALKEIDYALTGDAQVLAFLVAPGAYLAGLVVKGASVTAKKMGPAAVVGFLDAIDALTGRTFLVHKKIAAAKRAIKQTEDDEFDEESVLRAFAKAFKNGANESIDRRRRLLEQEELTKPRVIAKILSYIANDPDIKGALKNSEIASKISSEVNAALAMTMNEIAALRKTINDVATLEDLERVIQKKIDIKKIDSDEIVEAKKVIVAKAKAGMLSVLSRRVANDAKSAVQQGIPATHPYVLFLKKEARKIAG